MSLLCYCYSFILNNENQLADVIWLDALIFASLLMLIKMTGQWHTSRSNVSSQLSLSLTDETFSSQTHIHVLTRTNTSPLPITKLPLHIPFLAILFSSLLTLHANTQSLSLSLLRPLQWTIPAMSLSFDFAEPPIPEIQRCVSLTLPVLLPLVVPGTSWCPQRSSQSPGRLASRSLRVLVRRRFLSPLFCSLMLRLVLQSSFLVWRKQ